MHANVWFTINKLFEFEFEYFLSVYMQNNNVTDTFCISV